MTPYEYVPYLRYSFRSVVAGARPGNSLNPCKETHVIRLGARIRNRPRVPNTDDNSQCAATILA